MRDDLGGSRRAVRILKAGQECVAEAILLGSDHLDRIAGQQRAELSAAFQRQLPGKPSKESCTVRIANSGRVDPRDLPRNRYVLSRLAGDLNSWTPWCPG